MTFIQSIVKLGLKKDCSESSPGIVKSWYRYPTAESMGVVKKLLGEYGFVAGNEYWRQGNLLVRLNYPGLLYIAKISRTAAGRRVLAAINDDRDF